MNDIKKRLAKMLDVKTIITLSLLFAFIASVMNGRANSDELVNMFQMVVCFYFGTQAQKKADEQG